MVARAIPGITTLPKEEFVESRLFTGSKILIMLLALSMSCGLAFGAPAKVLPKGWWLANVHNSGPGPFGGTATADGNCESCLKGSGVQHTPAFTGVLTPVGTTDFNRIKGCQFYQDNGTTQDNGCIVSLGFFCPAGYVQSGNACAVKGVDPDKNKGCPEHCEANPINPLAGNKFQSETDYVGAGSFPLRWQRSYNSFGNTPGNAMLESIEGDRGWTTFSLAWGSNGTELQSFSVGDASYSFSGNGWRHSYDRVLMTTNNATLSVTRLIRPNSQNETFILVSGAWVPDAGGATTTLTQIRDANAQLTGWSYVNQIDEIETYDAVGKLLSIRDKAGLMQTMGYDPQGRLASITDPAGRMLTLDYNANSQLVSVRDPGNWTYAYDYDAFGNLAKVTYPGQSSRQYRYEDARFPRALTGIIDENGSRYATWAYDAQGKAVLSQHADGLEKVTLVHGIDKTVATSATGASRTYATTAINGVAKAGSIVETCGAGCSRSRTWTYDVNGNVDIATDWNGNKTKYSYDLARDLETQRIEAFGTPLARTVTTVWEPGSRLPKQIAEPLRITTFTYQANGKLESRSIQPSTDATGAAGLAATPAGTARTVRYTYNGFGQLLTITGPRTDVVERTTYVYDPKGDLESVTNAALQTSRLSNYDASGRIGRIVDPNGLTTDFTYTPRGWLATRTTSNGGLTQQTSYTYDEVGQLKKVTLPDLSFITYTYDDGHRLTGLFDSAGNSITYTLDDAGNRTREQVKDPLDMLVRQTESIFDMLNRVKQVTGAAQ